MIDLKLLVEHPEETKKALQKKHFKGDIDAVLKLDLHRRKLMHEAETLKAAQNKISKEIPSAKGSEREKLLAESKETKERLKQLEPKLQ